MKLFCLRARMLKLDCNVFLWNISFFFLPRDSFLVSWVTNCIYMFIHFYVTCGLGRFGACLRLYYSYPSGVWLCLTNVWTGFFLNVYTHTLGGYNICDGIKQTRMVDGWGTEEARHTGDLNTASFRKCTTARWLPLQIHPPLPPSLSSSPPPKHHEGCCLRSRTRSVELYDPVTFVIKSASWLKKSLGLVFCFRNPSLHLSTFYIVSFLLFFLSLLNVDSMSTCMIMDSVSFWFWN